jgi:hypothetical protein
VPTLVTGGPPFIRCRSCEDGIVSMEASDGRFFEHPKVKGIWVNLPPTLLLARCNECRAIYTTPEEKKSAEDIVEQLLADHAELINRVVDRFRSEQKP